MEKYIENIRNQRRSLQFTLMMSLHHIANELPTNINGFSFSIERHEVKNDEVWADVKTLGDLKILGHKWVSDGELESKEAAIIISDLDEFLHAQVELLEVGNYEYLKNISKDEL